ncbi:MAG: potassium transporter TrkG [Lachnospiraceae bacterium]|nr:potassium transporter TrkG [Lachnospiraceae bacterium]
MKERKKSIRFSTMQLIAAGFLGTILLGGVLLYLPICNTKPIQFTDALFTSTSAVCVTGLVTIVPATQFTVLGKGILLVLIQIGGLGVIACTFSFFLILKKKITLRERIIIQETYNMDTLSGLVKFLIKIIKGTFIVEGVGAILFSFQFVREYGLVEGVCYSIFHSVSAFCNAGIDILGNGSFTEYATNPLINFTTMSLIIIGGIGFTVWGDVLKNVFEDIGKEGYSVKKIFAKLTLHSKIAISMTIALILFGTVSFFVLEYANPETFGNMTFGEKLMASGFHSVSTRTAGFATVSQSGLTNGSKLITCLLMFVGGSPAGTAGGVKTTTVAMLILACRSAIKGGRDTECFGRRIAEDNIRTGLAVIILSMGFLITGTVIVSVLESDVEFMRVLYETTSAMGTVGLSADLTPQLETASKYVIMMLMYIGRIGPVTMALIFGKGHTKDRVRELPEKRILVG